MKTSKEMRAAFKALPSVKQGICTRCGNKSISRDDLRTVTKVGDWQSHGYICEECMPKYKRIMNLMDICRDVEREEKRMEDDER